MTCLERDEVSNYIMQTCTRSAHMFACAIMILDNPLEGLQSVAFAGVIGTCACCCGGKIL